MVQFFFHGGTSGCLSGVICRTRHAHLIYAWHLLFSSPSFFPVFMIWWKETQCVNLNSSAGARRILELAISLSFRWKFPSAKMQFSQKKKKTYRGEFEVVEDVTDSSESIGVEARGIWFDVISRVDDMNGIWSSWFKNYKSRYNKRSTILITKKKSHVFLLSHFSRV